MKKLSDFEEDEKDKIRKVLEAKSEILGMDSWDRNRATYNKLNNFGLCSSCTAFQYAKTEFAIKKAYCYDIDLSLTEQDPITECSKYSKRGEMSLQMMMEIAHIIEFPKDKIGFI